MHAAGAAPPWITTRPPTRTRRSRCAPSWPRISPSDGRPPLRGLGRCVRQRRALADLHAPLGPLRRRGCRADRLRHLGAHRHEARRRGSGRGERGTPEPPPRGSFRGRAVPDPGRAVLPAHSAAPGRGTARRARARGGGHGAVLPGVPGGAAEVQRGVRGAGAAGFGACGAGFGHGVSRGASERGAALCAARGVRRADRGLLGRRGVDREPGRGGAWSGSLRVRGVHDRPAGEVSPRLPHGGGAGGAARREADHPHTHGTGDARALGRGAVRARARRARGHAMSRSLGAALPSELVRRLSQQDLPSLLGRALPLLTVDDQGRPHPMLCSYLELLAVGPGVIRLAIGARSSARRNLEARGAATFVIAEPDVTMYVKCRAGAPPLLAGELARFELAVEDVLEDAAQDYEQGARITSGLTYAPVPALESEWARATLAALRLERA